MAIFSYKIFSSWLFYFMLAHFVLLVVLAIANRRYLWEEIKKIDKKVWLLLLIVFLYGFWLRNAEYWLGPHTDGYVAQESAHLWVLSGEVVKSCALGNHSDCQVPEQVLAPPGYPFIIALTHLVFGIHSLNASVISAILSSLTILLVFLITYLAFKKEEAALYAALVFSLIPLNIIYSQTGESRPAGLFFAGLAFLFYILAIKNNKMISWLAAIAGLSYAIYVRQESYALLPLFAIFFVIFKWSEIKLWVRSWLDKMPDLRMIYWGLALGGVFLILQGPVLSWLFSNNPYSSYQGGSIGFFSLAFRTALVPAWAMLLQLFNLSPIYSYIWHYNFLVSVIFLATVFSLVFGRGKKERLLVWGFFGAYFLVYSLIFDGSINGTGLLTGDYFRRATMFHLPVAVMAGYGFYLFNPLKDRRFLAVNLALVFFLAIFLNLVFNANFLFQDRLPYFISGRLTSWQEVSSLYFPGTLFKDARATKSGDRSIIYPSVDYWRIIERIPNGCLVIGSTYMMVTNDYFKENRRRAASVDLINDETKSLFSGEFQKSDCVVLIDDYRCQNESSRNDRGCIFIADKLTREERLFRIGDIDVYKMKIK